MTTKDIIRKTLIRIQQEGKTATPSTYKKIFCQEARAAGIGINECQEIERGTQKNILQDSRDLSINYLELLRVVFEVIKKLKDEKALYLAKDSISKIDQLKDRSSINFLKEKWSFLDQNIEYEWLNRVDNFIKCDKSDLKNVINSLLHHIEQNVPKDFNKNIVLLLSNLLKPSICEDIKNENCEIIKRVKSEPSIATSTEFLDSLNTLVEKRVELDRKEANRQALEIGEIADILSLKILRVIDMNKKHHVDIKTIKSDIGELSEDNFSIDDIKDRLLRISLSLDSEIENLNRDLLERKSEINRLRREVDTLKSDLVSAKKEASEDFLTKLSTKRVLEGELERVEGLYLRHYSNYSVAFFDIDHFKVVNDKYGHEAGDKILQAFGVLIKKHARVEDIIGRFGGEEFVALLPETNISGAKIFAEHIRALVQNSKFVYKDLRIEVTISAGVSERKEALSMDALMNLADKRLYVAKKSGRNRVCTEGLQE